MRTSSIAGSLLASFVAFAAYGCTLDVSGAKATASSGGGNDPSTVTSSIGGAGPSSSSSSSSGDVGGAGGMVTASASSTTGSGCVITPEVCDDGVDNDCDMKIDCADDDCTGATGAFECSPDTTGGWTVVAFDGNSGAPCPSGYGNLTALASAPADLGPDCSCNCGSPLLNPCTQGTLTFNFGIMGCGGTVIDGTSSGAPGACDALASSVPKITGSDQATTKATKLPPKTTSCGATATLSANPPVGAVTCTPTAPAGAGCPAQSACVPKAGAGNVCIQHDGVMSCPDGAMQRHIVAAPADVKDNRMCGACTCNSTATSCNGAKFTGYDDANCTKHAETIDIDGGCHFAPNGQNFTNNAYFKYTATPDTMNCAAVSATTPVSGAFQVDNPITVCCP